MSGHNKKKKDNIIVLVGEFI